MRIVEEHANEIKNTKLDEEIIVQLQQMFRICLDDYIALVRGIVDIV